MPSNQPLQQRKPLQAGTGYTNIQRILQANKTNKLGQTIASGVQQAGQAVRGSINQAGAQFKTETDKEQQRLAQEGARADRVLGDVTQATEDDINAFEGIRGAQSKGPTGIANADELKQKAREAQQLGAAGGTEGGRFGLLQRYVGGSRPYTGGQQRLDSLILGQTGAEHLRQARKSTLGLGESANTQALAAQEVGKGLQNQARTLADNTINRLGGQVVDYDKAMVDKITSETAKKDAEYQNILKTLHGQNLGEANQVDSSGKQEWLDALGIKEGQRLLDAAFNKDTVLKNDMIATRQKVQSDDDYRKYMALSKLSGNSLTGEASSALGQYTDASQVNQYLQALAIDPNQQARFQDYLASKEAALAASKAPLQAQLAEARRSIETGGNYNPGAWELADRLGKQINALDQGRLTGRTMKLIK